MTFLGLPYFITKKLLRSAPDPCEEVAKSIKIEGLEDFGTRWEIARGASGLRRTQKPDGHMLAT